MHYVLQEGSLTLPGGFQDRSVNLFIQGGTLPAPFSLTISRDTTLPGEALADYIDRQVSLISAKLRKYKLASSRDAQLGSTTPLQGIQIDAHYQSDGRPIYQRQAAFPIATDRTLVFSATSQVPFDDALNQLWLDVLRSFQQRQPVFSQP